MEIELNFRTVLGTLMLVLGIVTLAIFGLHLNDVTAFLDLDYSKHLAVGVGGMVLLSTGYFVIRD